MGRRQAPELKKNVMTVSLLCLLLLSGVASLQPSNHLTATLTLDQVRVQAGGGARVRLALENKTEAIVSFPGGLLFGSGWQIISPGGREWRLKVGEERPPVFLPPESSLQAVVDVAAMVPDAFAAPGEVSVSLLGEATPATPLIIDVWRDFSNVRALIETNYGSLTVKFHPQKAPWTVKNFVDLVEDKFYDNLTFHRVVKGFMVQGGCPRGDGTGNAGYTIPLEVSEDLTHERGSLSMARQGHPDSGSCQFFICHGKQPALDGNYSVFGQLVEGLDTLDEIADVACVMMPGGVDQVPSKPRQPVLIRSVRILEGDEVSPASDGSP
jgi:peptidyl-prolyl cis-trans isomerase B (cyclophilin B)